MPRGAARTAAGGVRNYGLYLPIISQAYES